MSDYRFFSILLLSLLGSPLTAAEHFILAAGGSTPQSSQVSIEKNVVWIDALMRQRSFDSHQLLFTSGNSFSEDIVQYAPMNPDVQKWLPLSRLYGQQDQGLSIFRHNQVPDVMGAATAGNLSNKLQQSIATLTAGDDLFFVYNGHGGWESSDTSENTLRLWDHSQLNVRQFANIMQSKPAGASVRYVFPQCYAGGFARSLANDVIYPVAEDIQPGQCGFFAVPDTAKAEGCTRGVDVGDYRDYSTFFFAALTGRTRQGDPLQPRPARHGKPVSLAEAHAWAYTYGVSTDIPFSTSEYFLELWQPWYSRWQSAVDPGADNPYFKIAQHLAEATGIEATDLVPMARTVLLRRGKYEQMIRDMDGDIEQIRQREAVVRRQILARFQQQWPAAEQPYSAAYMILMTEKSGVVLEWILQQPDYKTLENLQLTIERMGLDRLELSRQAARYTRLHRMLKLAAIFENFKRFASDEAQATYQSLLSCESWVLPSQVATNHE